MTDGDGLTERLSHSLVGGPTLATVMRAIARKPLARRDIAEEVGTTASTVSKAVSHLMELAMVQEGSSRPDGPGRPVVPLTWDQSLVCVGVKIVDRRRQASKLVGAMTTLGGEMLGSVRTQSLHLPARDGDETLIDGVTDFIVGLLTDEAQGKRLVGIGVEVGGHVDDGVLRDVRWPIRPGLNLRSELADSLTRRLPALARLGAVSPEELDDVAVIVDNDVTALAVLESLSLRHPCSVGLVAVYDEGIGGGLLLDGSPWRGRNGMVGEVGHLIAFDDLDSPPCGRCKKVGCVESFATPRVLTERTHHGLEQSARQRAAEAKAVDIKTFERGGAALGRGIVPMIDWVGPDCVVVYLPPALAEAERGSLGALYATAMRREISHGCFSTNKTTPVDIRSASQAQLETLGARAAAALVLSRLIERVAGSADRTPSG